MTENGAAGSGDNKTEAKKDAAAQQAQQVQMRVLGQFVRDLSFENVMAQKGASVEGQPDISVQVNLDAKKRPQEHTYESSIKLNIESKAKNTGDVLFLMEIEYVGIFHIEGVPEEQMHPFLLIECPRMVFPFLRRVVSDVTSDGGFPPLNLDNMDFVGIYRAEVARRQAAQAAAGGEPAKA
ncbi:MAG: protein-export chaperone SecB [Rhodobacteraceae bacterium]|nr:protein-export chaperone SecB [Paracoccaceae bacterium]